jgi:hypothetical protein
MPPLQIITNAYGGVEPTTDYTAAVAAVRFGRVEFDVPQGYVIDNASLVATIAQFSPHAHFLPGPGNFQILNEEEPVPWTLSGLPGSPNPVTSFLPSHKGKAGHRVVTFRYLEIAGASITIYLIYRRLDEHYALWQRNVWQQIRSAAEARYAEEQARLQEERDRLWRLLNGKDTLSLRRLEREELLRLVLQWLLGPTFPVAANTSVDQTLSQLLANERAFDSSATAPTVLGAVPTFTGIGETPWSRAVLFGEFVKFLQQAVEWENLLYFLYPYFWGSEMVGRDKMLFEHADAEHEKFLRAGYARVVLTVRPGFESDLTTLFETGSLVGTYTPPTYRLRKKFRISRAPIMQAYRQPTRSSTRGHSSSRSNVRLGRRCKTPW